MRLYTLYKQLRAVPIYWYRSTFGYRGPSEKAWRRAWAERCIWHRYIDLGVSQAQLEVPLAVLLPPQAPSI